MRNRCNQVPHLTQDINGKVTSSQLDTANESQEVSPFPCLMEFHTVYQLEQSVSVLMDVVCYFSFLLKN